MPRLLVVGSRLLTSLDSIFTGRCGRGSALRAWQAAPWLAVGGHTAAHGGFRVRTALSGAYALTLSGPPSHGWDELLCRFPRLAFLTTCSDHSKPYMIQKTLDESLYMIVSVPYMIV